MDALEFFALHHERLHLQVTRDFLQGLSEPQMRLRPQGLNSIAWLVWHMARCEDALNLLLAGRPQVLDAEGWLPRLQLSIRDVGTEMSDDEASDLDRFRAAGVFREKALWAIVERAGQTKGWWLGQLGIAHSQSHWGQATVIRLLQGMRR
jgi:hypothetical protein